jgi:hypothetical protein
MAENSNQEEAAVTQLGGGGGVWVKPLHIHGNFVWEVGGEGGRGGSMRKGGIY